MRIDAVFFTIFVYLIALCKSARGEVITKKVLTSTEDGKNTTLLDFFKDLETRLKTFTDTGIKMLLPSITENLGRVNLSKECKESGIHLISGIRDIKPWAMEFIDSSGKFPDGLRTGSFSVFGAYDECRSIEVKSTRSKDKGKILYSGQYCTVDIKIRLPKRSNLLLHFPDELKNFSQKNTIVAEMAKKVQYLGRFGVKLGLCTPSGCSTNDINKIIQIITDGHPIQASVLQCDKKEEKEFTPIAIVAVIYCSFLVVLLLIGSAIDIYMNYRKKVFKNNVIRFLLAFSLLTNFKKFCSTTPASKDLSCVYGMRFLSMTWVVLGHTYYMIMGRMTHGLALNPIKDDFALQIIVNGFLSVDAFFVIGGLLVSYIVVYNCKVKKHEFSVWIFIVHRLWRFLPAYSFIILCSTLISVFGSGPMWQELVLTFSNNCKKNWWTNLLFITNFFPAISMCLPHTWYVTADFQLYMFSILFLLSVLRWPKVGLSMSLLMIIASIVFSGTMTYVKNYPPTILYYAMTKKQFFNYCENLYFQPISHAGPYAIGLLLGYILATKSDIKISPFMQLLGWIIAFIMSFSSLYGIYAWHDRVQPLTSTIMFASFSKTSFALGVGWVILCCATKRGGIINSILSWKVFVPLCRLTFLVYLIHFLQMKVFFGNIKTRLPPDNFFVVFLFLGHLCVSYGLAFIVHMLVEAPFTNLEHIILHGRKKEAENLNTGKENNAFDAELQSKKADSFVTLTTIHNDQSIKS